jgi:two-component system sensor kinase FixL
LNQPLAAIRCNAETALVFLVQDATALDNVREILEDIIEDDIRASEVIQRLRLLLRNNEVQRQPLDMNEVVQEVLKLVSSNLASRNVAVNIDLSSGLPTVIGDLVLIEQVLLNLIFNGCDAMTDAEPDKQRRLHIHTLWNGEAVQVSVRDQGRGIALDDMQHLFEPFFTTKPQGMGLGLAICRTIINAHNGQLWAANNANCGASFYFTLPSSKGEST